jgi:serine/threonine protein kinase
MAPEILMKQEYSGSKADIFAAGIILFIMITGHLPFIKATQTDSHYKFVYANRLDLFWKFHSRNKEG